MDGSIRDEQRLGHHPHIHHPHVHNNGKTTGFASIPQTELHLGHHQNVKGRNMTTRPLDSSIPTDYHIMKVLDANPNSLVSISAQQPNIVSFQSPPQQQQQADTNQHHARNNHHQNQQQQQPQLPHHHQHPQVQQPHHHHNNQASKSKNGSAVAAISVVRAGSGDPGDELEAHKIDNRHHHHHHHPASHQHQGHTSSVSVGIALGAGTLESSIPNGASEEKGRNSSNNSNSSNGSSTRTRTRSQTLSRPVSSSKHVSPTASSTMSSSSKSPNKCKGGSGKGKTSNGGITYYHTYNPHNPNKSIKPAPLPECTENFGGWAYGSICDTTHCCNNFAISGSDGGGSPASSTGAGHGHMAGKGCKHSSNGNEGFGMSR